MLLTIGVALGIFKIVGQKWLALKFDKDLASFRHAQEKELERFKFSFNALMDRKARGSLMRCVLS
jgi:hypothetical protein